MVTLLRISSPLAIVTPLILVLKRLGPNQLFIEPLSIHIVQWWSESDAAQLHILNPFTPKSDL